MLHFFDKWRFVYLIISKEVVLANQIESPLHSNLFRDEHTSVTLYSALVNCWDVMIAQDMQDNKVAHIVSPVGAMALQSMHPGDWQDISG